MKLEVKSLLWTSTNRGSHVPGSGICQAWHAKELIGTRPENSAVVFFKMNDDLVPGPYPVDVLAMDAHVPV